MTTAFTDPYDKAKLRLAAGLAELTSRPIRSTLPAPIMKGAASYKFHVLRGVPSGLKGLESIGPDRREQVQTASLFRLCVLVGCTTEPYDSTSAVDYPLLAKWKTWVGTVGYMALENASSSPETQAGETDISVATKTRIINWNLSLVNLDDWDPTQNNGKTLETARQEVLMEAKTIGSLLDFPSFGTPTEEQWIALAQCGNAQERVSYYALIVYLCGRPPTTKTEAISKNRPRNLEDKFNNGIEWGTCSGPIKMSEGTWKWVAQVWELDQMFRVSFFRSVIPTTDLEVAAEAAPMGLIVSLLVGAQASHVQIIKRFIEKYPFVLTMPSLYAEISLLVQGVAEVNKVPAEIRAYAKLMYRDTLKAFDSRQLVRLIKLATDKLGVDETSLTGYAIRGADPHLSSQFDDLRSQLFPALPTASSQPLVAPPSSPA
jgi:serine/threonine protein kinase